MIDTENFVISDARIITADHEIHNGWLAVANGKIADLGEGRPPETGISLAGDMLIPGLVELHTDHLETHIEPRPNVDWHPASAVIAYDAQVAAGGITTVFDCLRLGSDRENKDNGGERALSIVGTIIAQAECGNLRAQHHIHLRCEICAPDVVDAANAVLEKYPVGIISLMDHTPGQRQFRDVEKLRAYYRGKLSMSEQDLEAFFDERYRMSERYGVPHRKKLVDLARTRNVVLASHDDTTVEHVNESAEAGSSIAEFPTTLEAAQASHNKGIAVIMGAPNLIRGGSHSGNVAASELARHDVLDIFSSDYIPASLIMAAFELPKHASQIDLPKAIATVTRNPAKAVGMKDRGEIAVGKRADLVHVRLGETPVVRTVWREGCRVL